MGNFHSSVRKESDRSKEYLEDLNVRIVRTYFDTPRKLAVLEIETDGKLAHFDKTNDNYYLTIKDRGLRTVERVACSKEQAKSRADEWLKKYKCTIYSNPNIVV